MSIDDWFMIKLDLGRDNIQNSKIWLEFWPEFGQNSVDDPNSDQNSARIRKDMNILT